MAGAESKLQKKIIEHLKSKNAYVEKMVLGNRSGLPDIRACYFGRFIAFEVKDFGKKATALQQYNLEKINKAGGHAYEVDSFEKYLQAIKEINEQL